MGDGPTASAMFDQPARGGSPVDGIGDRASLSSLHHPVLSVLRGTNYYMIAAHVDGDDVAIDKEIALAVV